MIKKSEHQTQLPVYVIIESQRYEQREEEKSLRCRHHTYSMCAVSERSITLSSSFEILEHDEELLSA